MLSAYVDGELSARETQLIETHLAHCDACAKELHTLRYTKELVAQMPTPSLPRSFIIRQADLEKQPEAAPRGFWRLQSGLAYTYLKGATAIIAIAFALLVAGDQFAQFRLGAQPIMAPAEESYVQKIVIEPTTLTSERPEIKAIVESAPPVGVEKEIEKAIVVEPAPNPTTTREPVSEKAQESMQTQDTSNGETGQPAAVEASPPTKIAVAQETCGAGESPSVTPTPRVHPTATPLPPSIPTLSPDTPAREGTDNASWQERAPQLSAIRIAEIGLGGLALILLLITLVVRRQQTW